MASEKRGIFYEALIFAALNSLKSESRISGEIFWNQTPSKMDIDTDITIGEAVNAPEIVILVSHCTSEHNSDMKFWRNMGELREVKLNLGPEVKVICILFDDIFKVNLLAIQPYAFDGFLNIGSSVYGSEILSFAGKYQNKVPDTRDEKIQYVKDSFIDDSKLKGIFLQLKDDLSDLIQNSTSNLVELWDEVKKNLDQKLPNRIPTARKTSLRRGLAKSLLFDTTPKPNEVLSKVYVELGLAVPSVLGPILADLEILDAANLLRDEEFESLRNRFMSMDEFFVLIMPLRQISKFSIMWIYVEKNWQSMLDPKLLLTELLKTHKNPYLILKLEDSIDDFVLSGWLLIFLITLIKTTSGKRMDYGYSKIVNQIDEIEDSEKKKIILNILENTESKYRSSRTIEYGMRDWIFGDYRNNFTLLAGELALISSVLSKKLNTDIGTVFPKSMQLQTKEYLISDSIETKLLSHPKFQPLKQLLIDWFEKYEIFYEDISYFPSPIRLLAVASGEKINIRAASTNVILTKKTLIRWVSVSNDGKDHKCKEYCGKIWGMRLIGESESYSNLRREKISKYILIIDGTFNDGDLELLEQAGWDEMYYPDEIHLLLKNLLLYEGDTSEKTKDLLNELDRIAPPGSGPPMARPKVTVEIAAETPQAVMLEE
jgi:hypothetical protein